MKLTLPALIASLALPLHTLAHPALTPTTQSAAAVPAGETVYLISSSSQYDEQIVPKIKKAFSQLGLNVDTHLLDQQPTALGYVNSDKKRAETLVSALSDNRIRYLWFIRGGSGALNLYPALYANRARIAASQPKVLVGFSDVTAIHHFVNHELGWKSIHGVLAAYNQEMHALDETKTTSSDSSIGEVFQTLKYGVNYSGIEPLNDRAYSSASGTLDGGNLTLVQSFFDTRYARDFTGNIVMLEDIGVSAKQLDRTLHQLSYSKTFHPRGVVFGQFWGTQIGEDEKALYRRVLTDFANRVNYPVYFYPVFGHGKTNQPFIMDQRAEVQCHRSYRYCSFVQPGL